MATAGGIALFVPRYGILSPRTAHAAIAVDQTSTTTTQDNVGTSFNLNSFGSLPAVGSCVIVAGFGWNAAGFDVVSVGDNQGNSYTVIKHSGYNGNNEKPFIAYALNVNSSGTFTPSIVNLYSSGNYVVCNAISFTGIVTSLAQDQTAESTPGSGTSSSVTSGSTTQADELVIASNAISQSGDTNLNITTPTSGYTDICIEQDFVAHATGNAAYKIVAATGAQSASWGHDSANHAAIILTLKAFTGGTGFGRRKSIVW